MKAIKFLIPLFFIISTLLFAKESDTFTFSGDRTHVVLAKGKKHTLLSGNAVIVSDKTVIHADDIELFGSDFQFAVCKGKVRVFDEERGFILTCDRLFYDRDKKISRVQGYAEMEDQKNELVVKGGFLEDRSDEDITIIQIGVRILKISDGKPMTCRSEFALYRRKDDILELSGMPRVYWKGDEYSASRIVINLENDEINLEGEVSGTIVSDKKEETENGIKSDQ